FPIGISTQPQWNVEAASPSTMIFPALLGLLCLGLIVEGSSKKGVAVPSETYRCGDFHALRGISWWYDWGQTPYYHNGCGEALLPGRVPMVWGWRNGIDLPLNIPHDATAILGFNEPNFHPQSNISPQAAAQHWRELQNKVGAGRVLVSPSPAPCGGSICMSNTDQWFREFFAACHDCRVDYIATHAYWCDPDITMHYLEGLWNEFHKQIWLTEFSCPQKNSVAEQLAYMRALLPRLESAHYVAKYSWFASRFHGDGWAVSATSLLDQHSSTLTQLGHYYVNF
ncbi:hypothetical protein BaRGS_00026708, partial [Batillaria attramentaria]